jgi:hypothetical protein
LRFGKKKQVILPRITKAENEVHRRKMGLSTVIFRVLGFAVLFYCSTTFRV